MLQEYCWYKKLLKVDKSEIFLNTIAYKSD